MALDQSDLESLQRQAAALNDQLFVLTGTTGKLNQAELDRLKLERDMQAALARQRDAIHQFVGGVSAGVGKLSSGLAQGQRNLQVLNGAFDFAAKGIAAAGTGLAAALKAAGKKIPVLGDLAQGAAEFNSAVAAATRDAAKFVLAETDKLVGAFETLGQYGLTTAGGLEQLSNTVLDSRMDMAAFQKIVSQNGSTLAMAFGTTSEGAQRFGKAVATLSGSGSVAGEQLRALGEDANTMGERMIGFLDRETRMGRNRAMTEAELASGTAQYARELDAIARLTGKSKSDIQAQQQALMSAPRFRAAMELLGDSLGGPAVEKIKNMVTVLSNVSPAVGEGFRDILSGTNAGSEAAKNLDIVTKGRAGQIAREVRAGRDVNDAMRELATILGPASKEFLHVVSVSGDAAAKYGDVVVGGLDVSRNKALQKGIEYAGKKTKEAADTQNDLTKKTIEARLAIEEASIASARVVLEMMPLVGKAATNAAQALEFLTKAALELLGKKPTTAAAPGAGGAEPAMAVTPGQPGDALGAVTGITRGRAADRRAAPGTAGAAPGTAGAGGSGRLSIGPNADMSGVDPTLLERMNQFAQSYGNPLQVTSAFRTDEKQAELWFRANVLKEQGIYSPAQPVGDHTVTYGGKTGFVKGSGGRGSSHTQGLALDISGPGFEKGTTPADEMLAKFGLHRPLRGTDPVHVEPKMSKGGILTGPTSGYGATLHGTEAVVPLPDGRSIPVQSSPASSAVMEAQLDRLDTLISIMRNQVSISSKILSYSS